MIKVTEILFPFKCLNNGEKTGILVEVKPYYKFVNGTRTDELEGFRYTFILHQRDFEKITVKVPSEKPIISPEELKKRNNNIMAEPIGCSCKFFWNQHLKTYSITASAEDIILEV